MEAILVYFLFYVKFYFKKFGIAKKDTIPAFMEVN